jgi:arabinofuranosyltransferase
VVGAGVIAGALATSFLCDDAYITFRHVANLHAGHGLVWNAPPFVPVEGCTSFLWAMLLWLAWLVTGQPPPATANWLLLACGLGTLWLVGRQALRVRGGDGCLLPAWLPWLGIVAIAGNRTFVWWLGSGLETALFQLCLVAWTLHGCRLGDAAATRWSGWSALAAVTALVRPDGLLCVLATGAALVLAGARGALAWRAVLRAALPLLVVVAHLLWRRATYGAWLPNTYAAKVVAAWPAAGCLYFANFVLEHGTWAVVALAAVVGWRERLGRVARTALLRPRGIAVVTVLAQTGYYTLVVGGDHFDYRVYVPLVPLCGLLVVHCLGRLPRGAMRGVVAVGMALVTNLGWAHWALTRDVATVGFVALADRMPAPLQPLFREYDRIQAWLRLRLVGLRCEQHAEFAERMRELYPPRGTHGPFPDGVPVHAAWAIGIAGWSMPDIAIVDQYGLCDRVVAHTPVPARRAPPGPRTLRCMFRVADRNGDQRLDFDELHAVVRRHLPIPSIDAPEFVARVLLALGRGAEPHLDPAQFLAVWQRFGDGRCIAHERRPPPGYVDAFAPNIEVEHGSLFVLRRSRVLRPDDVRAVESAWWAKVADAPR